MTYEYDRTFYSYDRTAKERPPEEILAEYHMEGLTKGTPVTLYHGTTRLFRKFDLNLSRDELVNSYYGRGIFLTPSKVVAAKYAGANRNMGFDPSIITDLKRKNGPAGDFLQTLYNHGNEGWDIFWKENGFWIDNPPPGVGQVDMAGFDKYIGGLDSNDLQDIAGYIIGSKTTPLGGGEPVNIFNMSTGVPGYIYDLLDQVGINSKVYRPKIYTVTVTVSNPLVTKSQAKARKARQQGYDSVFYYGPDLVQGIPEVAVYSPRNVRISKIQVID